MKNLARYNNIEYFMPFLFCNDLFIPVLHKLFENDINPIKYVYGAPFCEWGLGTRKSVFKLDNLNFVEKYFEKLKTQYNVTPTLTFTNLNIKDKLNDDYCNKLLDIAYSFDSRFIVSTDELYNHIKSRYPEAKMHSSVVMANFKRAIEKDFNETEFYNRMLDKCEVIVVRPEYIIDNTNNIDKLISDISRIEVLINSDCQYNCPNFREHYKFIEDLDKDEKLKNKKYNNQEFSLCPRNGNNYRGVYLTNEQVEKIIELGVKKIKLQGRGLPFSFLFNELYKTFFNNEYSQEELRNRVDKICAEMLQLERKTSLLIV